MNIKLLIFLACFLLLMPIGGVGAPPLEAKKDSRVDSGKPKPIKIDADRLDANNEKRMVTFTGNVVAVQEDRVIKADRLILHFKKETQTGPAAVRDPLRGGELDRIEAKGRVNIQMEERTATGDDAVFIQDTQQIILTGNATLREGPNLVKGEKVTVFLEENRGMVEGSEKVRVSATIYTTDVREKKK